MSQRKFILMAVLFVITIASQGICQKSERIRTGPLVGIGLGGGISQQGGAADITEPSFAADFKLGLGLNEKTFVYLTSRTGAYNVHSGVDVFFFQGFVGTGATFFLRPAAPTPYGLVALGRGLSLEMYAGDNDLESGFAYQIGGGVEFIPGLSLEATVTSYTVDRSGFTSDVDVRNFLLTLNWTWY